MEMATKAKEMSEEVENKTRKKVYKRNWMYL